MQKEVKMIVKPSPLEKLTGLLEDSGEHWEKIRPQGYPKKLLDRLPRGYILDMPGTYTFTMGDEMLVMGVIYKDWVSIQALNRTEPLVGGIVIIGKEMDFLVYWELVDGEMVKFPTNLEASRDISLMQLIIRQRPGVIEVLDIGDEKATITGRFLSGEED